MNVSFPGLGVLAALVIGTGSAYAQAPQDTGGACIPVAERAGRPYGCFIHGSTPVGALDTAQAVWHLETFPTVDAAAKARTARGLVVEAFDKVWLLTIAPAGFRSPGGTQVAGIGPIPGRTPMAVPISTPSRQNSRLFHCSAVEKPSIKLSKSSIGPTREKWERASPAP